MKKITYWGLVFWIFLVVLAIINGAVRNFWYKPIVGDLLAHQISTFTFISGLFIITFFFIKKIGTKYNTREYVNLGLSWVGLTVIFEFIFGHYVFGNSWEKLLADYNIVQGRLWVFVLIATALAPLMTKNMMVKKKWNH